MASSRKRLNWQAALNFINNSIRAGVFPVFRRGADYKNAAPFKMLLKKKLTELTTSLKLEPVSFGKDAIAVVPVEAEDLQDFPCLVFFSGKTETTASYDGEYPAEATATDPFEEENVPF